MTFKTDPTESAQERAHYEQYRMPEMATSAGLHTVLLTTPLFSVARRKPNAPDTYLDATYETAQAGFVHYQGKQLTQAHLTVLLGLARLCAGEIVSSEKAVFFRPSTFLAAIGWSDKSDNIKRLMQLIDDLQDPKLLLWKDPESKALALRTRLVLKWKPMDAAHDGQWWVLLDESLVGLFKCKPATFLKLEERQALREGLGTFLYGFIKANDCVVPFSYEQLHTASGSTSKNMREFADGVAQQLNKMVSLGILKSWAKVKGKLVIRK